VDEFYTLQDKIKTSIWAFFLKNGADRDLSVKDWAFHREKRISLIFGTSEAQQKRVIQHIIEMGLGGHIIETFHDLSSGMKMSFKMPLCFKSQHLATLIEAIFVINNLTGNCGSRELRTDRPRSGSPYVVCTIHFPDSAVEYAEQHDWRLQGLQGHRRHPPWEGQLREGEEEEDRGGNLATGEPHSPSPQTPLDNCASEASL
jgi:hypothetical protein